MFLFLKKLKKIVLIIILDYIINTSKYLENSRNINFTKPSL